MFGALVGMPASTGSRHLASAIAAFRIGATAAELLIGETGGQPPAGRPRWTNT